jgi:uncharacterized membrane protein YcgQ (UPF0703/DUF1980 family)
VAWTVVGARPDALVRLESFVLQPAAAPGGSLWLARMYITCCVADAIALGVGVRPPAFAPRYANDTWLELDGAVQGRGRDLSIRAARVAPIPDPRHPYLSFGAEAAGGGRG